MPDTLGDDTTRPWKFVATVTLAGVLVVLVLSVVVIRAQVNQATRVDDLRTLTRQNACVAHLEADFAAAVGEAFATPPAPNTSRLEATTKIKRAAEKLHDLTGSCRTP